MSLGLKRPQDRIEVPCLGRRFQELMDVPVAEGGFGIPKEAQTKKVRGLSAVAAGGRDEDDILTTNTTQSLPEISHGQVLIIHQLPPARTRRILSVMIAAETEWRAKPSLKASACSPLVKTLTPGRALGSGDRLPRRN